MLGITSLIGFGSGQSVESLNYTTWDVGTNSTLSDGDLTIQQTSGTTGCSNRSVLGLSAGKFYYEVTVSTATGVVAPFAGVTTGAYNLITSLATTGADDWWYDADGRLNTNGSPAESTTEPTWKTAADVVGVAVDTATGKIWFKDRTGAWLTATNDADVAAGNNPDFTAGAGTFYAIAGLGSGSNNANTITANFGASAWAHSAPSGFTGLGS